jgi:antitoxin component of RelBE/YafQ-DinJ toxin-antitoxin module
VPNQPKTPVRTVRVPDDIWDEAVRLAAERGTNVSEIVRSCLARYGDDLWNEAQRIAEQRGETVSDVLRGCLRRYVRRYRQEGQQ